MVETAVREKWTDQCLDDLNAEVDRRLERLDQNVRDRRTDIKRLTDETNRGLDHFNRAASVGDGTKVRRSFKRHSPASDSLLTRREPWTDERIDDLRLSVSAAVTRLDGDIHVLRDDVEASRSELTARFAAQGRLRRRPRRCQPVGGGRRSRSQAASSAIASSGHWTDGRLSDFQHSVDLALAGLECDIEEIKVDTSDLRAEMDERLRRLWSVRFEFLGFDLVGALYGITAGLAIGYMMLAIMAA